MNDSGKLRDAEGTPRVSEAPAWSPKIEGAPGLSRLSKNILYNVFGQGLLFVIGFVAVKYTFKQLGADALGILYFSLALNGILSQVLELGMGATTVREISGHTHEPSLYIHNFLRTASLFYWGGYILLAVALYCSTPWLVTRWLTLRTLDTATATSAIRVLGVIALLTLPRSLYAASLRGLQRMEFNNAIDVGVNALQQIGTIAILGFRGGLLGVVYWLAVCFGFGLLSYVFIFARFFSFRSLIPGYSAQVVERNFSYTSRMASISLSAMVQTQADKAIVSGLLPLGTFGYYAIAYSAVSRGSLLTGAISQAAFPSLAALHKAGDHSGLMVQYRKLQDLLCLSMVPLFAAIPFAALPLFSYMLNEAAARLLLLPITFLALGFYMNGTLTIPYLFSLAVGKPGITARANFYALFGVLPVTFALVYFFGLNGAGFSWVFYHLFLYAYQLPRTCRECLFISPWEWFAGMLRIGLVAGFSYGAAWAVLKYTGIFTIPSLILGYISGTTIFLVGAYKIVGVELGETFARVLQTIRASSR